MPTENEFKFVLEMNSETDIAKNSDKSFEIEQGYLFSTAGVTARIRKKSKGDVKSYSYTFKYRTPKRVIELEQKIDRRDFNELWEESCNILRKRRYCWANKITGESWDIDIFRTGDGMTYFCMAECESVEDATSPLQIPEWVNEKIIYRVEQHDGRFSSRKLSDSSYATKVYRAIKELSP